MSKSPVTHVGVTTANSEEQETYLLSCIYNKIIPHDSL